MYAIVSNKAKASTSRLRTAAAVLPLLSLIFRSGDYHPHGTLDHLPEVGFACMRILFSEDSQSLVEAPQGVHGLIVGPRNRVGDLPHLFWCQQTHA